MVRILFLQNCFLTIHFFIVFISDWCGPDQCNTSINQEEAQETLAVTIDNEAEEVLAVYQDDAVTMGKKKPATAEVSYVAPNGRSYECKSDCRVLFAASRYEFFLL